MARPDHQTSRTIHLLTTIVAGLAAVTSLVLVFTVNDPPQIYALAHVVACAAIAVVAWRRPWVAMIIGVIAGLALFGSWAYRELALPLHGSYAHAEFDEWSRGHFPFDIIILYTLLAFAVIALGALTTRVARRSKLRMKSTFPAALLLVACAHSSSTTPTNSTSSSASETAEAADFRMICDEATRAAAAPGAGDAQRNSFAAAVEAKLHSDGGRGTWKTAATVADNAKLATLAKGAGELKLASWSCPAIATLYGPQQN